MPPLQKIPLSEAQRRKLADYLSHELIMTRGRRAELERKWEKHLTQWRAQMPEGSKDFPFVGASNNVFPLTDIHFQPVYSDFMQALHTPEDYWTPTARRPDRADHAAPLRRAMTALDRNFLRMRHVNARALIDQNILGTAIYKSHWLRDSKTAREYDLGTGQIVKRTKLRSQPRVDHVPLQHFYIPADAWHLDPDMQGGARWVAQKFFLTKGQLRARAGSDPMLPTYDREGVEKVLKFDETPDDRIDEKLREQAKFEPFDEQKIELFEVWCRWSLSDSEQEVDLQVIFHVDSNTILRAIYTPFIHGHRPFHRTLYLPTGGFYGMGMAETDEWAQHGLTQFLRALIDNALIANTKMFAAPLGTNISPGEPIYPGKIWMLGPDERIQEVGMGDINQSLPLTLSSFLQWSEMRTGVSELRQGNINNLPSRTPATTVMSVLREGNKRFDMILSMFRDVHGEIGLRTLQNWAQEYRDDAVTWNAFLINAIGENDAMKVAEILSSSQSDIEGSIGMQVTATSALVNKEAEKQTFIGMMQIIIPMYQQLVQTAMLLQQVPPGTPAYITAAASYSAGVELIEKLLERFDIPNPSQYLGALESISGALNAQMTGQNAATAGLGAPAAPPQQQAGIIPPGLAPQDIGALFGL